MLSRKRLWIQFCLYSKEAWTKVVKLETTLSQHHASEWVDLIGTDVGQHTGGFGLVADQVAKVRRKFEKAKPGVGEQLVEKMEAWEATIW